MRLLLLAPLLASCVTISSSSYDHQRDTNLALGDAAQLNAVHQAFARRGFPLVDRKERPDGSTLFKYKGSRGTVMTVSGDKSSVSSTSIEVGSVFYAIAHPAPGGGWAVVLFGTPTYEGREPCAEHQPEPTPCEKVQTSFVWPGLNKVTGREEAETVRGVMVEIQSLAAPPQPAAVPAEHI